MSDNSDIDQDITDGNISSSSDIPFKKPRFLEKCLRDSEMSTWLRKQEDGRVWCDVCETHLNIYAGKFGFKKHANTSHHKMNTHRKMEGAAGTSSAVEDSKNEIKELEIRYCLFAVERNVSFETLQSLNKLNQIIGSKLPLMQCIELGRTKIRAIIKNVINKSLVLDIKAIVQEKYFSIIIDESTDIANIKNLNILVRFMNNKRLETHVLDLIDVKEATAVNIFKCITNSLNKFNLSVSKIVGIGVDKSNNSLMTRFKDSNSEIITFPCLCHSMHLVATHATKCIEQILNQWLPLYTIFADEKSDTSNENSIFYQFTNDFTKPYLEFLNYILKHFYQFNILFQSDKILIHKIHEECKTFIRVLAAHFVKQEFLKDGNYEKLNVNDQIILLPLDNIFIGAKATKSINNLKGSKPEISNEVAQFYKNIQKFYQIAYIESIERLPFNNQFVNALNFLHPEVALDYSKHVGQIEMIVKQFPSKVIGAKAIDQWFLLAAEPSKEEREKLKKLDVTEFWSTVSNLKDILGNLLYDEIGKLAFICLSLPHSNADVERCFSMLTDVKNKKRNRLGTQMVCALTRIKLYLQSKNIDACGFKISDQMLQCFNSEMYDTEQIPSELNGVLLPDETENSSSDSDVS